MSGVLDGETFSAGVPFVSQGKKPWPDEGGG